MKIRWFSNQDVSSLVSIEQAIPLVEEAFRCYGLGKTQMPPKMYLDFSEYNGDLRIMPAYLPFEATPFAGVKVVNSHPDNPKEGLPTVTAVLVLNDPKTGMPLAIMSAGFLTDLRTGAAGAVAAKYLAKSSAKILGLIGCGRQAMTQMKAISALFPIKEIYVSGKTFEEAKDFCERQKKESLIKFIPGDIKAAAQSDIVVTTTPSRNPLLKEEWVREGTHINAIGADAPGKQELETVLIQKACIVVDGKEQAFHSGEVNVPLRSGALNEGDIHAELGSVVSGEIVGRKSSRDITVFDSTGLAIQDIAIASFVYKKALEKNIGVELTL